MAGDDITLVSLNNVEAGYRGTEQTALRVPNISLDAGETLLVLGASDSGKSTLCRLLCGFLNHFYHGRIEGDIFVCGMDPRQSTLLEMIQCAGMVFQRPETQITGTRFSVREEVACGPENLGLHRNAIIERVEDALERTKLTHLADRNPLTLSGGEKQRLALASILALRPSLLVLDEATSQLDPVGEQDVMDIVSELARQGTAVIIAATTPEGFSEQADKVAIMQDGELTMLDDTRNAFASNLLPDNGIARPICMELALKARAEGLWPEDLPLPLSMGEAAETLATIVREAGHAP